MKPVERRAEILKSELTDSEGLSAQVHDKELLITELKKAVKAKADDVAESKIRIGKHGSFCVTSSVITIMVVSPSC